MKKIILICGLLASSFSFGADWKFAAAGSDAGGLYVDNSFYQYDHKKHIVDAWFKSESYVSEAGNEKYVKSKYLFRLSCSDKKYALVSHILYDKKGGVIESNSIPVEKLKLDYIVPDSVGESMWEVACSTKGQGFKLPKWSLGERLSKEETQRLMKGATPSNISISELDNFIENKKTP